jgi:sentrin-specific protease 7
VDDGKTAEQEDNEILEGKVVPKAGIKRERPAVDDAAASKRFKGSPGPSEDERRLTGDYRIPAGATPITVTMPGWPGTPRPYGTSRPQGIKPMNRLHEAPHASASARPAPYKSGPRKNGIAERYRPLPVTLSTGNNVRSRELQQSQGGDGFTGEAPSQKKRKITHVNPPVDLTKDDDEAEAHQVSREPIQRNASPVVEVPRLPREKSKGMFSHSEQRLADGAIHQKKSSRKPKDPNLSSRASSSVPSCVETNNGNGRAGEGSRQTPVQLDDDSQTASKKPPARRTIGQEGTVAPSRPPINLGDGVDDYQSRGSGFKRGSKEDVEPSGNVLLPKAARQSGHQHEKLPNGRMAAVQPSRALPESFGEYASRSSQENLEAHSLRVISQRAEDEPTKGKLKDKMQAHSKTTSRRAYPHEKSFSSEDELHGGNTVRSAAGGSAPPQKLGANSIAASVIPQSKLSKPRKAAPGPSTNSRGGNSDSCDSIQVHSFYASFCVLTDGDIRIAYDKPTNRFEIYHNGVPAALPGKQSWVSLGPAELRKFLWAEGCSRLVIQSSITDNRYSKICIQFEDCEGVKWFQDWAHDVAQTRVEVTSTNEEQVNKRFKKLSEEAQQHYEKMLLLRQKREEEEGHDDIQYESTEPTQPKRSEQAKGRTLPEELNNQALLHQTRSTRQAKDETTSAYFQEPTRRSTRQTNPVVKEPSTSPPPRWTVVNQPKRWPRAIVYPPKGARRVTVEFDDLKRLDEGEFLNDNVVGFALRQLEETMAPELKEQVHFFSSFFFTTLSQNGKKKANYDGVKRWTKNTDLFSKPFVVVPICQDLHWFVAIICNLDKLARRVTAGDGGEDDEKPEEIAPTGQTEEPNEDEDSVEVAALGESLLAQNGKSEGKPQLSSGENEARGSSRSSPNLEYIQFEDNGLVAGPAKAGDEDEISVTNSRPGTASGKKSKRKKSTGPTVDPESPLIITLDSLGWNRSTEIAVLKEYVKLEAMDKRAIEVERPMLKGVNGKGIPWQSNFCDCGVYLIEYIEHFTKDPAGFVQKVVSRELDEKEDFANFDPSAKRDQIRERLLKLQQEQDAVYRAEKKQKHANANGAPVAASTGSKSPGKATPAPTRATTPAVSTTSAAPREEDAVPKQVDLQAEDPSLIEIAPPVGATEAPQPEAAPEPVESQEQLEYEPAKPLEPGPKSDNSGNGQMQGANESDDSEDSDDEEDKEMLDNGAGPGEERERPLLDLDQVEQAIMKRPSRFSAGPASRNEGATRCSAPTTEKRVEQQKETEIIDIEDCQEVNPVEIPDSQEAGPSKRSELVGKRVAAA